MADKQNSTKGHLADEIPLGEDVYRVITGISRNGGFLVDGGSGELKVSQEQLNLREKEILDLGKDVGGNYSCCLTRIYIKHKNDPWTVFRAQPKNPMIPRAKHPRKDFVLKFNTSSLSPMPELVVKFHTPHSEREFISKKTEKSLGDTWRAGHIIICNSDAKKFDEVQKIKITRLVQISNWACVIEGQY